MGIIINPRGPGGAGKTELVRRVLRDYGWTAGRYEALWKDGRNKPIGYRLQHPLGGRPLVVIGHYERTSGGCDTIPLADGGLDEAFRLAAAWAAAGHDVLLEGSQVSSDEVRSLALAELHPLFVLLLDTGPLQAARNLAARRRSPRSAQAQLAGVAVRQGEEIARACRNLSAAAVVEHMSLDKAYRRSLTLLGVIEELRA